MQLTNLQTFDSILKTGMSDKIRALRKALEASGGKQAQPQQAYGKLLISPFQVEADFKTRQKERRPRHPILSS